MTKRKPGKTTVSPGGLIKKTFWFHPDEVRRLRKAAYEEETSQAELVRTAVRRYFGMAEPNDDSGTGTSPESAVSAPAPKEERG